MGEVDDGLELLRYTYHNPGLNKSMLMSTEGKFLSTKNKRIDELHLLGLIEEESDQVEGRRKGTYFGVTPLGEEVVMHLEAIYNLTKDGIAGANEDYTVYIDPDIDGKLEPFRKKDGDSCGCE